MARQSLNGYIDRHVGRMPHARFGLQKQFLSLESSNLGLSSKREREITGTGSNVSSKRRREETLVALLFSLF